MNTTMSRFSLILTKEEMENICNGFDLDITFTILNLQNSKVADNDNDNKDSELQKLGLEDLNSNSIISLNPSNMNNLRLGNKLDLYLKFSFDYINSQNQLSEMDQMIYLKEYDETGYSFGDNIYPSYINYPQVQFKFFFFLIFTFNGKNIK